ncbi:hypothetical protein HY418_00310 [Candidatus Kaiserbacteria bacterium]|nr:hypothetical protein [Candidatus Kaiserbacteria bacterium]
MKPATTAAIRFMFYGLALGVLVVAIGSLPANVSAAEISSQTQQILPFGPNQCDQLPVTGFTPYIYDGALHSFDFVYPDASYVTIVGSVGDTSVPLNFMTRNIDSVGTVRMHVDIPTTPVAGQLPIRITLLSSRGAGQPVCAATVSMTVSGPVAAPAAIPTAPASTAPSTAAPNLSVEMPAAITNAATGSIGNVTLEIGKGSAATTATGSTLGGVTKNLFDTVCASTSSVYSLWVTLLILYVLLVGALLWSKWPASWAFIRSTEWRLMGTLLPLAPLLALWYFSPACRGAGWLPLIAMLTAGFGAFMILRPQSSHSTQLLLIDDKKKE